jgi:hypothetical protein
MVAAQDLPRKQNALPAAEAISSVVRKAGTSMWQSQYVIANYLSFVSLEIGVRPHIAKEIRVRPHYLLYIVL